MYRGRICTVCLACVAHAPPRGAARARARAVPAAAAHLPRPVRASPQTQAARQPPSCQRAALRPRATPCARSGWRQPAQRGASRRWTQRSGPPACASAPRRRARGPRASHQPGAADGTATPKPHGQAAARAQPAAPAAWAFLNLFTSELVHAPSIQKCFTIPPLVHLLLKHFMCVITYASSSKPCCDVLCQHLTKR